MLEITERYQLSLPADQDALYAFLDESGIYFQLEQTHDGALLSAHLREIERISEINLLNIFTINKELILSGCCLATSSDQRRLVLLQHLSSHALNNFQLELWLLPFITKARLLGNIENAIYS